MKNLLVAIFAMICLPGVTQENSYQLTNVMQQYNLQFGQRTEVDFHQGTIQELNKTLSFQFGLSGKAKSNNLVGGVHIVEIKGELVAPQGKQKIDTRNLNNKTFDLSVPINGGVTTVTGKNPGVMLGSNFGGIIPLEYLLSYQFIELPSEKLKVGIRWESKLTRDQIEGVASMKVELNLKHKVLKKEKINGIRCYKIETSVSSATETDVEQHGTNFTYDGKSTAQVIWYFDTAKGRIMALKAIENSEGTLGGATLTQETTFELSLIK